MTRPIFSSSFRAGLFMRLGAGWALGALAFGAQAAGQPAPPPAPPAAAVAAPAPAPAATGRIYVTVAGDDADRVVKKTMAELPLKESVLREALIQANPKAFPSGRNARLKAGTELALPDPHALLRHILLPLLQPSEAGALFPPPPTTQEERRRWVRYP